MRRILRNIVCLIPVVAALTGCGLVDEDMQDCETDYQINYELRLVTNMTTELETELSVAAEVEVATALRAYLQNIFTDFAHDVDLGFYDVVRDDAAGDSLRLQHQSHIMDANQSSYTLYIPIRRYEHLAVANIEDNSLVSYAGGGLCHEASLVQEIRDTVDCHRTGLFTARMPIDIREGEDQEFHVKLYMANCASSVVIDTTDSHLKDIRVYATGFANAFSVCDSIYRFQYTSVVRADKVEVEQPGSVCYTCVTFPSRDTDPQSKTIIETEDPFVSQSAEGSLWRYKIYATCQDGTVTESVLGVFKPLRAGQLKIIKVKVYQNGSVQSADPTVGVSVTLDWQGGQEYPIDL